MDQQKITAQQAWNNLCDIPTKENFDILVKRMNKEGKTYKNIDGMNKDFANKYIYGKKLKNEVFEKQLKKDVPKKKSSGAEPKTENDEPSAEVTETTPVEQKHEVGNETS